MTESTNKSFWHSPLKVILLSGFVAGTLDMSGALIVYVIILQKTTAIKLLQSIASGVFGKNAYSGGTTMALGGLLFHFVIAFCFAIAYFFIFPYWSFLRKHKIISGLLYGIFVWLVMNLVVLSLVFEHRLPPTWSSFFIGASILMVMIGLPVSIITHKYYADKNETIN